MSTSRIAAGLLLVASVILVAAGDADAQRRGGSTSRSPYGAADHRLEIVGYGGYRWTVSIDASRGLSTGQLDVKNSGFWGLALDINVPAPDTQIRLAYDRQESDIEYKNTVPAGAADSEAGTVEYLQIGALKGLRQNNILPFGLFTLGASRFAAGGDDTWKFAVVLGLGAKIYVSDRIGLLVQGRMPYSFLSSGITLGTGGVGVGGWGVAQFDIGGGITILI